jgi:hypothetical protein
MKRITLAFLLGIVACGPITKEELDQKFTRVDERLNKLEERQRRFEEQSIKTETSQNTPYGQRLLLAWNHL